MEPLTIIIIVAILAILIFFAPQVGIALAALAGFAFFFPQIAMGAVAIAVIGFLMFAAGGE